VSAWTPAAPAEPQSDPTSEALDFTLTQFERSQAAIYACELEANRIRQNERDMRSPKPARLHPVMAAALAPFAPIERAA
jgi:hypothetical protein